MTSRNYKILLNIKRISLKASIFPVSIGSYAAIKLDKHVDLQVPTKAKPMKQ